MKEFSPYYYFVYWLFVMLLTIDKYGMLNANQSYMVIYRRDNYKPMIWFSVLFILIFGFRPISEVYFGDTINYAYTYGILQSTGVADDFVSWSGDWLFNGIMFMFSQVVDVYFFFAFVLFFYIVLMFVGCKKLDDMHGATLMLFCIGAFSFYGYAVNGIRNGVACSIVILAMAGVCKGERIWPIILAFIAIGCHKSTALPLACMFFSYFMKDPKLMYIIWGCSFVLSLLFGETISSIISLIDYDERLSQNIGDITGNEGELLTASSFRWDFLIYSIIPMILGAYTIFKRKIYDNTYLILLGTYIYANSFWLFVNRTYFSNRYAYLSWFIYPILLAYPLMRWPVFEKSHSQKTALILLAHFGFTTVMWMLGK